MIGHAAWAAVAAGAYGIGFWQNHEHSASGDKAPSSRTSLSIRETGDPSTSLTTGETGSDRSSTVATASRATSLQSLAIEAMQAPSPIARRLAFAKLLEAMTPENALSIRESLVALNASGGMWRDFNYHWGSMSGKEAVDFAASSEEEDLSAVLGGWASANPTDAMAFLQNLPEEMRGNRNQIAASIISGLADKDTGTATDFIFKYVEDGGDGGNRLIQMVAAKTLSTGAVTDAATWSEGLPDGAIKGAAMDRIARDFVNEDPEAAASWIGSFADEEYAARAVAEVGGRWGRSDPSAAVEWLEDLPDGRGVTSGLNSVFGNWEDDDPLAASERLLAMPQSDRRDSAISGFSRGYAWQDPAAAITWAQDISDPALRQETLTQAGRAFYQRQPEAALEWMETSGLPEASITAILTNDRRRGRR